VNPAISNTPTVPSFRSVFHFLLSLTLSGEHFNQLNSNPSFEARKAFLDQSNTFNAQWQI